MTPEEKEAYRVSMGLQRKRLACVMESHDQCDGLVPGGKANLIPCLCQCHTVRTYDEHGEPHDDVIFTKSGKLITEADIAGWVEEFEQAGEEDK